MILAFSLVPVDTCALLTAYVQRTNDRSIDRHSGIDGLHVWPGSDTLKLFGATGGGTIWSCRQSHRFFGDIFHSHYHFWFAHAGNTGGSRSKTIIGRWPHQERQHDYAVPTDGLDQSAKQNTIVPAQYNFLFTDIANEGASHYYGVARPFKDTKVTSYWSVALGGIPRRGSPMDP